MKEKAHKTGEEAAGQAFVKGIRHCPLYVESLSEYRRHKNKKHTQT